jgi:hypothetical protein
MNDLLVIKVHVARGNLIIFYMKIILIEDKKMDVLLYYFSVNLSLNHIRKFLLKI